MRSTTTMLAAGLLAATAMAAGGPLQVTSRILSEHKARAADGSVSVSLVPARRVVPGDRIVVVLGYRNTGSQPIANIVLDNPVPSGIAYRGPAAASPAPDVSVDGRTFAPLAGLRVTSLTGAARAAGPDDVVAVRWRLAGPVAPGGQGQLSFQGMLK